MAAGEIDVVPIEPQGFASAGASVEHKRDQRAEVVTGAFDKPVSFFERQPTEPTRRCAGTFKYYR